MGQSIAHDCKTELRKIDLKATPARIAVLEFLEMADQPVGVGTIIEYLKRRNIHIDPATAFRIINIFTLRGLTRQVYFNEGKLRYELSSKSDHHHFMCESCGSVTDIADCKVNKLHQNIQKKKGVLIKRHSLEFFGLCNSCQKMKK